MKLLDLKQRIVVLWIWGVIGMTASLAFVFLEPARLELAMSRIETLGVIFLIVPALFGLIPMIMAFLTVVLKDRANRLTNRTLSIIYTAFILWDFVTMLLEQPAVHQILIQGSVIVAAAYIIFYSWKWPVKEA
jgi:hypothetical protein